MTLTLRTRLAVASMLTFGLLVGAVSVVTYRVLVARIEGDVSERVAALAEGLHGYLRVEGDRATVGEEPDDSEEANFLRQATQYFQVYDVASGRLLAQSEAIAALGLELTPVEVQTYRQTQDPVEVETDFGRFRLASSSGTANNGRSYLLQVAISLATEDAALAHYRSLLLWRVPVLLLVGALAFWWLSSLILRPLIQFASASESVDINHLETRMPVRGSGDEIDVVATAFNRTLARLEQAVSDMRQFSAALAHELRTPLAALRGQIELSLGTPGIAPVLRERFALQLEEVDRLTRLINQILTLARAESGGIRLRRARLDLGRLVAAVVDDLEAVAEAQGLSLTFEESGPAVYVDGDAGWLERVVINLVDNAIKYSSPPGRVVVRVGRDAGAATLVVQDSGIGLSEEDAARVFERFFRADPARPRSKEGAGLGLSLVRWVAEAHGGAVSVSSRPGCGSTFTVLLPRSGGATGDLPAPPDAVGP